MILSEVNLSEYLLTFHLDPRYFPPLLSNLCRALVRSTDERDWPHSVRAVPARSLPAESIRRDEPVGCGQARKDDRRLWQPVQAPDSLAPLRWFRLSTDFSGFNKNNPLTKLGKINIWVNSRVYNHIENIHQIQLLSIIDLLANSKIN